MTHQIATITPAEMPPDELALAVREYQLAKLPPENRVAIQIGEDDIIARGDALLTEASKITAVTDKATRAQAHATGQALIKLRTEVERKAKALRDDSNAHSKACIAAEKRLVARTRPAEDAVILLRDQFDAAEKARKEAHEAAIRSISARAILPPSMPSTELQAAIDATRSYLAGREWEEYAKQAKAAADAALSMLDVALALALEREAAEAKAREEAARAEAERLAREAVEREAREAAEREAARVSGLKAALADLELSIARRIRAATTVQQAKGCAEELAAETARFGDKVSDLEFWAEFADDAREIIRSGWADALARFDHLEAVAKAEMLIAAARAAREAAEREAAELAQKIATERAAREAEERAAAEAQAKAAEEARLREAAAKQAALAAEAVADDLTTPPAPEPAPVGIRWGELCAAIGCEIPPWVLAAMGCESVAGNYTPESLQALVDSLDAIRERVAGLIK